MEAMRRVSEVPAWLLVPHYLLHSALYYRLDTNILTDHEYDQLARRLYDEWDTVEHRHKYLIHREALKSGGSYIQFPLMVMGCAKMFKAELENNQPQSYLAESEKNMALNARSKGQRGEREVIDLLQPHINEVSNYNQVEPPMLQRNTLQSDCGGYDIVGLTGFALEVKRVEKDTPGAVKDWWAQAVRQAKAGEEPVLFFRMNGRPWNVRMFVRLKLPNGSLYKVPGIVSVEAFIFYMKAQLHGLQTAAKQNI